MTFLDSFNTYLPSLITLLVFVWGVRYELRQNRIERRHKSRIHFDLEARFLGPQKGYYIAEFVAVLSNAGFTRCLIDRINLIVKGIPTEDEILEFKIISNPETLNDLVEFPVSLIETNMLAKRIKKPDKLKEAEVKMNEKDKKTHRVFVEPGVTQRISYVARIPDTIRFVLLRSSFKYHLKSKHSTEKVFEVSPK